jgi:hypothetical protein
MAVRHPSKFAQAGANEILPFDPPHAGFRSTDDRLRKQNVPDSHSHDYAEFHA